MKILYLNVFEGALEEERFKKIVNFINKQNADILGLSELNNWKKNDYHKLKNFQKLTDYKYVAFCDSNHGFHLALFSKKSFLMQKLSQKNSFMD